MKAFGVNENPTLQDFEEFLEDRCFPRERYNINEMLIELKLDNYNPLEIIKNP